MRDNLELRIKYLSPDIEPIKQAHAGEWYDLRCARDIYMEPGEFMMIPLGVAMQLPEGYEAIVAPRSSTFKNYGILLTNGIGIIDSAYCGDGDFWHFPAYATRETTIPKNTRICQFRILKCQPEFEIIEVDHLGNPDRNGLGSTGKF
jgi:dUTP pyrophosphatase